MKTEPPSHRAQRIAAGLVRTGRAATFGVSRSGWLRADGTGATYWVAGDGGRVLRGVLPDDGDAVELQSGFVDLMVQAAGEKIPAEG
jgi:hypothetical protein